MWSLPAKHLCKLPGQQLPTLACPSVWGWYVLLNWSIVPSLLHNLLQKLLKSLVSLYDVNVLGMPCKQTTSWYFSSSYVFLPFPCTFLPCFSLPSLCTFSLSTGVLLLPSLSDSLLILLYIFRNPSLCNFFFFRHLFLSLKPTPSFLLPSFR